MTLIGIMQGRLVPQVDNTIYHFPRDIWAEEFALAAQANLDCIEWIYDLYGADVNPLSTDDGIEQIKMLSKQHNVQILSLCANCFMEKPLVRASTSELKERLEMMSWLLHRCQLVGINRIVLPFLDASRIDADAEFESVITVLKQVMKMAEETGVAIHLETSLVPSRFAELLAKLPSPMIKVNYDLGNSASLGYNPQDEFAAYGMRIGSVHVKDRIRGGGTVSLGTGDANFEVLSDRLKAIGYKGDFILEAARGTSGDEVPWAKRNREFMLTHLCGQSGLACKD
ncbi:MAG: sugar phosphate isomerase/epimerase [Candidatus Atribacteria bacterium]|nr:sugar phosphate isomerase/epimerase [Candidatus Atribacteria bacterium]